GDSWQKQRRIADGSQIHEKHPTLEPITHICCHLQSEASLARPPWSSKGHQAHLLAMQEVAERCHFVLTSQERRRLDWQVVGEGVEGAQRREGGREASDQQLEETRRESEVLETMRSQILQGGPLWQ